MVSKYGQERCSDTLCKLFARTKYTYLVANMTKVSNSPWQLYPSIAKFLRKAGLPKGSMHLKHYNGFLYGLLEPKVQKKKFNLESILSDFPQRKFILVGDSGEMDLEAYVNLACDFPNQILAIYIRDVTTNCDSTHDFCSFSELNGFFTSSVPRPDEIDDLLVEDSACCSSFCCIPKPDGPDLSSKYYNRPHSPPPLVPKPASLKGFRLHTTQPQPSDVDWLVKSKARKDSQQTDSTQSSDDEGNNDDDQASGYGQMDSKLTQGVVFRQPNLIKKTTSPKVPRKPANLRSIAASATAIPNSKSSPAVTGTLSTSATSTISPMAERLANFSSTFDDDYETETPGYSIRKQQDFFNQNKANKHVLTNKGISTSISSSNLSSKFKASTDSIPKQYNKPLLPVRPHNIANVVKDVAKEISTAREGTVLEGLALGGGRFAKPHIANAAGSFMYRSNPSASQSESFDKRLDAWKRRVARARMMLPNGIRLRMWRIGEDISDECDSIVSEYLDNLEKLL